MSGSNFHLEYYHHAGEGGKPTASIIQNWTSSSDPSSKLSSTDPTQDFFCDLIRSLSDVIDKAAYTYGNDFKTGIGAGGFGAIVRLYQKDGNKESCYFAASSERSDDGKKIAEKMLAYLDSTGLPYTAPMMTTEFLEMVAPEDKEEARSLVSGYQHTANFPASLTIKLATQYGMALYGALCFDAQIHGKKSGAQDIFDGKITIVFCGSFQVLDLEIAMKLLEVLMAQASNSSVAGGISVDFSESGLTTNRVIAPEISLIERRFRP